MELTSADEADIENALDELGWEIERIWVQHDKLCITATR
jgi:hypothetical protein